jgi:cob(I)alamin adenosyltransferase
MKIYTKTGDKGKTSLIGGTRVWKNDARLEAYGTIDELNAFIGVLITSKLPADVQEFLIGIQHQLFTIGSFLATDRSKTEIKSASVIHEADVQALEQEIDRLNESLPPIRKFILPGGSHAGSVAHVCRAITRRAERKILHLVQTGFEIDALLLQYVNRLSDYLFVLSRYLTVSEGNKEIFWES